MKTSISFLKSLVSKEETIKKIEESNADYIHVDVMDGEFVEEKTFGIDEFVGLLQNTKKPLDVHLMMNQENAKRAIEQFAKLSPEFITVHLELPNVTELINQIRQKNIKVGLAINPDTPLEDIFLYLSQIDLILVMSVYPGKGGQQFLTKTKTRLQELKELCQKENVSPLISIDGGINETTIQEVRDFVDIVVSGSFVCMSDNYNDQIKKLK